MKIKHLLVLLLVSVQRAVEGFSPYSSIRLKTIDNQEVSLGKYLQNPDGKTLFIFGTYAADFNAIEYAQRLKYYLPILQSQCGVTKFGLVLNCQPEAASTLMKLVNLDTTVVDVFVDNTGEGGKQFGVERGFLADNEDVSPFLKLFFMLWGFGASATLPAVVGGYIGNPFTPQPWIEDALAVGQTQGRWPDNALDIAKDGSVTNKFSELPLVGGWKRRPLELATLRLQSMIGISLANWEDLSPDAEALEAGVLTQLGGLLVVENDQVLFEWRDPGICAVANFENILKVVTR